MFLILIKNYYFFWHALLLNIRSLAAPLRLERSTFNEEIHIERCIQSAKKYSDFIYIVDSFSTDKTISIAKSHNVNILQNKFVNYSNQFSWALNNINFKTDWIMRLDADEYLSDELINEMANFDESKSSEAIVAIDARGFIFGSMLSQKLRKPLILARKKNKLPGLLIEAKYGLEYGKDSLSIQESAIKSFQKFVIVDTPFLHQMI